MPVKSYTSRFMKQKDMFWELVINVIYVLDIYISASYLPGKLLAL